MRNKHTWMETIIFSIIFCFLTVFSEYLLLINYVTFLYVFAEVMFASFLFTHIIIKTSHTYKGAFLFQFILTSSNTIILYTLSLSYEYGNSIRMPLLILITFLAPEIYCLIHHLLDHRDRTAHYARSFWASMLLFSVYYIGLLLYCEFKTKIGNTAPAHLADNYIPFYTVADRIEDLIYKEQIVKVVLSDYILPTLLYLPYGFIMGALERNLHRWLRFITLLLFPIGIEVLQFLFIDAAFNIDDIIFGLLGSILGQLCFFLINAIFLKVKRIGMLDTRTGYRGYLYY